MTQKKTADFSIKNLFYASVRQHTKVEAPVPPQTPVVHVKADPYDNEFSGEAQIEYYELLYRLGALK